MIDPELAFVSPLKLVWTQITRKRFHAVECSVTYFGGHKIVIHR
jgi:hypothetical protein